MIYFVVGMALGAVIAAAASACSKKDERLPPAAVQAADKNSAQWTNLMNYDGSGRGQNADEC